MTLLPIERTFCDLGGAEARLDENISALGTERGRNSLGQSVNAGQEGSTTFHAELQLL